MQNSAAISINQLCFWAMQYSCGSIQWWKIAKGIITGRQRDRLRRDHNTSLEKYHIKF